LNCANDDVLPSFPATPSLIEHAERFSDSGRVPEKNLQASFGTCFLDLQVAKQFIGRFSVHFAAHGAKL
jgi:hypothetical protein